MRWRAWTVLAGLGLVLGCAERMDTAGRGVLGLERPPHTDAIRAAVADRDEALRAFYAARQFAPLFVDRRGVERRATHLVEQLERAGDDGLHPSTYEAPRLRAAVERVKKDGASPEALVALELELAQVAVRFARDLSVGRTLPKDGGARWDAPQFEPQAVLARIASDGVEDALKAVRPKWPEYQALRDALREYRELEARGGWPIIDRGPVIEPGAEDPRVPVLRQRLVATGELDGAGEGHQYDEPTAEAVKRFQKRHGLEEDGRVGGRTLKALRVPVQERIAQLELSMERWRWTPPLADGPSVLVNVPAYELAAYDGEKRVLRMKTIVGLPDWQTPLFLDEIEAVRVHPAWTVPPKILSEEVLPKLREDPEYGKGYEIVELATGATLARDDVDWSTITVDEAGYRIRQPPGAGNPLGTIKFELPNRFAVYLHDTDAPKLFEEADRAISHGCVRVQDPIALAKFLLHPNGSELEPSLDGGVTKKLALPRKVPVQFVYVTAWKDDDGTLQFRDDLYDLDRKLASALKRSTAGEVAAASR